MVLSTRDDVRIDRCVDRCRKQETWYVRWSMRFLVILEFSVLFHNSSAPDFRMCRQLFRAHVANRQPSKSSEMDSQTCDCNWCKWDSSQTIDVTMSMLSHGHYGPALDTFHVTYNRLREALEYLLKYNRNWIRARSLFRNNFLEEKLSL